jgi:hypothetical protein
MCVKNQYCILYPNIWIGDLLFQAFAARASMVSGPILREFAEGIGREETLKVFLHACRCTDSIASHLCENRAKMGNPQLDGSGMNNHKVAILGGWRSA